METEIILDPRGSIFISVTNQKVLDPSRPLRIIPHSNPIDMHRFYKKGIHCFDFSNEFSTNDIQRI